MALNGLRLGLGCGIRSLRNGSLSISPKVRNFSLSSWSCAEGLVGRSSLNFLGKTSNFPLWQKRCIQTDGDKAFADMLQSEIEHEKKSTVNQPNIKEDGFKVEFDDALVTLTKNENGEKIVVKFSINNSVTDELSAQPDEKENEDNLDANMVSKPAFVVSITKGNGYTLCLRCVFSENDLDNSEQTEEHDMIEISEVTVLKNENDWEENVYSVEGPVLDGIVYDHLLQTLDERGIDGSFVYSLTEFSTNYEHKKYVDFLENLQQFTKAK